MRDVDGVAACTRIEQHGRRSTIPSFGTSTSVAPNATLDEEQRINQTTQFGLVTEQAVHLVDRKVVVEVVGEKCASCRALASPALTWTTSLMVWIPNEVRMAAKPVVMVQ